jgi:hypothetical protein
VSAHTVTLELVRTDTGFHKREEIKLPIYNVLLDGEVIGQVRRAMVTHERRGKGLRYVYARWQSPGWRRGQVGQLGLECRSRRDGIEDLLEQHGIPWEEARELAKGVR